MQKEAVLQLGGGKYHQYKFKIHKPKKMNPILIYIYMGFYGQKTTPMYQPLTRGFVKKVEKRLKAEMFVKL